MSIATIIHYGDYLSFDMKQWIIAKGRITKLKILFFLFSVKIRFYLKEQLGIIRTKCGKVISSRHVREICINILYIIYAK